MKSFYLVILLTIGLAGSSSQTAGNMTDREIADYLVRQSIKQFTGICPCPYSRNMVGIRCGKLSAWNQLIEAAPLCYSSDVSQFMIDEFRYIQIKKKAVTKQDIQRKVSSNSE